MTGAAGTGAALRVQVSRGSAASGHQGAWPFSTVRPLFGGSRLHISGGAGQEFFYVAIHDAS